MDLQEQNVMHSPHLSAAEIDLLLDDVREPSTAAVAHLETCAACQARLAAGAAPDQQWSEAQLYLSGGHEERWEPDTSQAELALTGPQAESPASYDLVLKLLDSPNHPELLGRLGRYDIERVIGSGGMGVVLKAHDAELNRPIAIKLLAPHLAHVGAARERFAREGRAAAAVVHEHVVAIYNVESGGPVPFLVMQYVPGRSLEARVTEDGPLGVEEILRIGTQAASGLTAAHRQGLVHRDVKPANILLENSVERAILTDFGLARAIDDASLTQTGILAGTPHYMSPEQALGEAIDHRSDLFSLGAVLYFMATGHPPFRGSNALGVLHRICREAHRPAWRINKDIPDELSDVIDKLLAKKPARRPASAEDVQEELAALLSRAQQHGLGRRPWHRWRANSNILSLVVAAVSVVLVVAAVASVSWWSGAAADSTVAPDSPAPSTAAEAEAGSSLGDVEQKFVTGMGTTLGELETAGAPSRFLHGNDGAWQREMEAIERNLTDLEALNSNSDSQE
jgi:serine/threonine protein kinase